MRNSLFRSAWSTASKVSSSSRGNKFSARSTSYSGIPKSPPLGSSSLGGRDLPGSGRAFDNNFVAPQVRKKSWEGQDKDTYFREKFAHVHARQRQERELRKSKSPYKQSRSFTKNKLNRYEQAERLGIPAKKELNILLDKKNIRNTKRKDASYEEDDNGVGNIKKNFARSFANSMEVDPRREFIYGTGPVIAALQAKKREIIALHTRERQQDMNEVIKNLCKTLKIQTEHKVPEAHLNIMTNNGVHNKYVLEVRPLGPRQLVSLGDIRDSLEESLESDRLMEIESGLLTEKNDSSVGADIAENVDINKDASTDVVVPSTGSGADDIKTTDENVAALDETINISEVENGKIVSTRFKIQSNNNHRKNPLVLYIDEVTDSHNFGAILRSAYYLGVDFVAYSEKNSAKLSPVVDKTSAGAMEHLQIFNVPQPLKFFEKTKSNGWNIIATSVEETSKVSDIRRIEPSGLKELIKVGPCMLVVGSEGEGLRTALLQRSSHVVTWNGFQDKEKLDSLNVSVATGLLLSRFYDDTAFDMK